MASLVRRSSDDGVEADAAALQRVRETIFGPAGPEGTRGTIRTYDVADGRTAFRGQQLGEIAWAYDPVDTEAVR